VRKKNSTQFTHFSPSLSCKHFSREGPIWILKRILGLNVQFLQVSWNVHKVPQNAIFRCCMANVTNTIGTSTSVSHYV